jgi:hypothetical protein
VPALALWSAGRLDRFRGVGQLPERRGELAGLARIDHRHRQATVEQGDRGQALVAATGFENDQPGRVALLLLKVKGYGSDDKNVHIHLMNPDGTVGARVPGGSYRWSEGWNQARPYAVGGVPYLFLLKKGDGIVHVHRLNDDGTVGARSGIATGVQAGRASSSIRRLLGVNCYS